VFPDAHLFCVWGSADALLVAAPPGRSISLARLESPRLRFQLERARLSTPEQIAAYYIASGPGLRDLAAGGELDTDDRPFVEYQAPRDMIEVGREYGSHHPGVGNLLALPVVPPPGNPLSGWPRDRVLAWRARQRLAGADAGETEAVLAELRDAGFAPLAAELSAANSGDAQDVRDGREGRDASDGGAAVALEPARSGLSGRDYSAAGAAARQALASATGAARLEPLLVLAVSEFAAGRPEGALGLLHEAQAIVPSDVRAYKLEVRVRLAAGDAAGARRAIEHGLIQAPGDTTLMLALRALEKAGATPR
jgi:hypothetical protein